VRRRSDKPTVRIEHRPMHVLVREYFAGLNDSAIAASSERENGHREPMANNLQPEG